MRESKRRYEGSCHCGRVRFAVRSEPITQGMRCNCSICRRRNAVMSAGYFPSDSFELISGAESLSCYRFAPHMVNHYFCSHCGIYPFHDAVATPGTYRVNLGCIDDLNIEKIQLRMFDGRDSWKYLD